MKGLSDLHCHLQMISDNTEISSLLDRAKTQGVNRFVCAAANPLDFDRVRQIQADFSQNAEILTAYGIHPWFCPKSKDQNAESPLNDSWLISLESYLTDSFDPSSRSETLPFFPAVGEIGLDYALRGIKSRDKEIQRDYFRKQLAAASEWNRPVIIHSVRAARDTLALLADFPNLPLILFHSFLADNETVKRLPEIGQDSRVFFSFSERILSPKNQQGLATFLAVPSEKILLETDYPSFSAEPGTLPDLASKLAPLRNDSPAVFLDQICRNEQAFFDRWPRRKQSA